MRCGVEEEMALQLVNCHSHAATRQSTRDFWDSHGKDFLQLHLQLFPHCVPNETDDKDGNYPQDLWESVLVENVS